MSITAPIAQLAEAADLKSAQCRFESDWGHQEKGSIAFRLVTEEDRPAGEAAVL